MVLAIPAKEKSSELDAFRNKVYVKAKEMAKKHHLCDVVDKTLDELGIEEYVPDKRFVEVTYTVEATTVVTIDANDFAGLSEEDENKALAEIINKKINGDSNGAIKVKSSALSDKGGASVPPGYVKKFVLDGRVAHLFPADTNFRSPSSAINTCYRIGMFNTYNDLFNSSRYDTGRICSECEKRVNR